MPIITQAYEPDKAIASLAQELAECAAYGLLASDVAKKNANLEQIDTLTKSILASAKLSAKLSNKRMMKDWVWGAAEKQMKEIENNYSNLSVLKIKYENLCKLAINQPKIRYRYWLTMSN